MRCAIAGSPGRNLEIGDVKNDMVIEVKQIRPKMPLNFGSTATSNLPKDNEIIQTSCKKKGPRERDQVSHAKFPRF